MTTVLGAWSGKVGTGFPKRSCSNKKLERDDDSKRSHHVLVQNAVAAFGQAAIGRSRIKFGQLRLQVLIDHQQRLQRAVQVAIATGHDFVDGGLVWSDSHPKPFPFLSDQILQFDPCSRWIAWIVWIVRVVAASMAHVL